MVQPRVRRRFRVFATAAVAILLASTMAGSTTTVAVAPDYLMISPDGVTITAGHYQAYTAHRYTAGGIDLGDVTGSTTFTINGEGTCTGHKCGSTVVNTYTVTGTSDNGETGLTVLKVNPAALDDIVISPGGATIKAGHDQAYTAEAYDQYGNDRGDVTGSTDFSIDGVACTGHKCGATVAGTYTVAGTKSGKTATVSLTVTPAAFDHITIDPDPATIKAGHNQTYTAEAYDQYNNDRGDVTGSTDFSIDKVGACTGHKCGATVAGTYTVTGTRDGTEDGGGAAAVPAARATVSATATLFVVAAAFDHIVISPKESTITAGSTHAYAAEAYDQYGNDDGDVTGSTTFTIDGSGTCTGTACGSTAVGTYTVTATRNGSIDTATLHVVAGALYRIMISPDNATILAGTALPYDVEGFDSYNNDLGNMTGSTTFTIDGAGTCTGTACGSTAAGTYTVTGTTKLAPTGGANAAVVPDGTTGTATLHVIAIGLDHIVISPNPKTIPAGTTQTYTAEAYDVYNNDLGDVTGATTFTIDGAGTCTGPACGSTAAGTYTVTGTYTVPVPSVIPARPVARPTTYTDTATLHVTAGTVAHIVVSPDPKTIVAGTTQAYTTEGFDAFSNSLGDVTGSTTFALDGAGTCTGNLCGSTGEGTYTVTATFSLGDVSLTDTASLIVVAAAATPSAAAPTAPASEVVEGATSTPVTHVTLPPTSSGGNSSGNDSLPLLVLLISLAFGGLGLMAVQVQRKTIRR